MERNSSNENFEHFLRQNAEGYRMHPSPKVWDSISDNLAKRKRRFYFSLFALLISSSILGYTLLDLSFIKLSEASSSTLAKPSQQPNTNILKPNSNLVRDTRTANTPGSEFKPVVGSSINKKSQPSFSAANLSIAETSDNDVKIDAINGKENWMADLLSSPSQFINTPSNSFLTGVTSNKNSLDFDKLETISHKDDVDILSQRKKAGKFSMMFYFTPTVSYRKLSENKSYMRSAAAGNLSFATQLQDVNNAVTHKPNIGLELGLTSKYAITKNVKLRAGVQFNINRYNIQAIKHYPELTTIALNNGSSGVQSLGTISTYRNLNGGPEDWVENFYFQVSTPIGAEVKLGGNDKVYIGAAGTVQPTYVLGENAYLVTTDYKNYAQVPSLMRRWNVNTNLETFVAYSTGKLNWQVGPQVRYQLLSSFANQYPVKENLFDFGLKVGISVNPNQ